MAIAFLIIRQYQRSSQSGVNYSPLWRKNFLSILPNNPWAVILSSLVVGKGQCFLPHVNFGIISFIFFFFNDYLFLVSLGLHWCTWALSSCSEQGLLFLAIHGLLIVWLLLLQSIDSRHQGFSSCGIQAQLLLGMWNLPKLWIKPESPHWQVNSNLLYHQGSPLLFIFDGSFLWLSW